MGSLKSQTVWYCLPKVGLDGVPLGEVLSLGLPMYGLSAFHSATPASGFCILVKIRCSRPHVERRGRSLRYTGQWQGAHKHGLHSFTHYSQPVLRLGSLVLGATKGIPILYSTHTQKEICRIVS